MSEHHAVRRVFCLTAAAAALLAVDASAAPTIVTFSVTRPTLRIESGKPDGVAEILVEAAITQGDEEMPRDPLIVADTAPAGSTPMVEFNESIEVPTGDDNRRVWRVRAALSSFPQAGITLARKLSITWGSFSPPTPLTYWASNAAAPSFTWKVTGLPAEWSAKGPWCIPIRVASAGQPATGIVLTSTLVEQTTKKPLASGLFLSLDGTRTDAAALEAAINYTQRQISLCGDAVGASPGRYTGILNFAATEKPEGDPVPITLLTTTTTAMWLGIGALGLGCVAAYLLRVLAPAQLMRSQALLPAALVRSRVQALLVKLQAVTPGEPTPVPVTMGVFETLLHRLSEHQLEVENLVPRRVPSPFGGAVDGARYKVLLDDSSAMLSRLDLLVHQGFVVAQRTGSADLPAVLKRLDDLMLIDPPLALADLRVRIDAAVQTLVAPAANAMGAAAHSEASAETLSIQIEQTSRLLWVGSVGLSFVIGLFVLVLNNPAFGVPVDYLYCFVWGFGIPAVAGQLTGATATTALGITLPKPTT